MGVAAARRLPRLRLRRLRCCEAEAQPAPGGRGSEGEDEVGSGVSVDRTASAVPVRQGARVEGHLLGVEQGRELRGLDEAAET